MIHDKVKHHYTTNKANLAGQSNYDEHLVEGELITEQLIVIVRLILNHVGVVLHSLQTLHLAQYERLQRRT